MKRFALLLVCVLPAGVPPAGADGTLRVLAEGHTAAFVGTQWVIAGEDFYHAGPQTDGVGNVYVIAGGAPGLTIVRSSAQGVTPFAEVAGAGDPRVMGLWFDRQNHMIVVVRRLVVVPEEAPYGVGARPRLTGLGRVELAHEHAFYRIKGFPPRYTVVPRAPAPDDRAEPLVVGAGGLVPLGPATGVLALCMVAVSALLLVRLPRDLAALRRRP